MEISWTNQYTPPLFQSRGIIQLVVANLYTKFEVSILYDCGDIFDKKPGEKEKRTDIKKNKQEKAHFQSNYTNLNTKFEVSILNGCGDIVDEKSGKKEKGTNTRKNK